jgi:hypothetical protein
VGKFLRLESVIHFVILNLQAFSTYGTDNVRRNDQGQIVARHLAAILLDN